MRGDLIPINKSDYYIGLNMEMYRRKNRIPLYTVADALHVNASDVKRYELGIMVPNEKQLEIIADALRVTPKDLRQPVRKFKGR